jgi:carotenoid cleavage dioxygenase-like enzyme
MSENYLVFIEQPLILNTMKLVTTQVKGKSLRDCMTWSPKELVRFSENACYHLVQNLFYLPESY